MIQNPLLLYIIGIVIINYYYTCGVRIEGEGIAKEVSISYAQKLRYSRPSIKLQIDTAHISIQYQASNIDTSLLHTLINLGPWI